MCARDIFIVSLSVIIFVKPILWCIGNFVIHVKNGQTRRKCTPNSRVGHWYDIQRSCKKKMSNQVCKFRNCDKFKRCCIYTIHPCLFDTVHYWKAWETNYKKMSNFNNYTLSDNGLAWFKHVIKNWRPVDQEEQICIYNLQPQIVAEIIHSWLE